MADPPLVLASGSPRRLDLLRLAGLDPVVEPADVDETPLPGERPHDCVRRLAAEKARARWRPGVVVVAADTIVVAEGESLGKPTDDAHAVRMLRRLAGRTHGVTTGVTVVDAAGGYRSLVVTTEVVFAALSDAAIAAYVSTGEPGDKAGAYAIQGRAAAFVERICGSWTNVVGLPLVETVDLLRGCGYPIP